MMGRFKICSLFVGSVVGLEWKQKDEMGMGSLRWKCRERKNSFLEREREREREG